jgi:adenylate kinase
LTHISAGDLLRAEVAAGTDSGNKAQEYMQKGMLVPDEIVVTMVKNKLLEAVDQSGGWLLDGYPRSLSQAEALDALNIRPQLFILLDVPDEVLVQRSVGRRYDPVTGKIYHLMYAPPETPEIAARLTHRLDDTEEKVGYSTCIGKEHACEGVAIS